MKTIALAPTLGLLVGCMAGSNADAPLPYNEFKAQYIGVTTDQAGVGHMFYDWDMPLRSEGQVAKLYDAYVAAKTGGTRLSEATVNTNVHGDRDTWDAETAKNLTYCISDTFGDNKQAVVTAMEAAAASWNDATKGTVKFVYESKHDATCDAAAPVVFDVKPGGSPYARAFMPSFSRAERNVLIHADTFDGTFPAEGILRHELGHILGLRHETTRDEAVKEYGVKCFENIYFETLTDYDDQSVMTTPACMGRDNIKNKKLELSASDITGIQLLYP